MNRYVVFALLVASVIVTACAPASAFPSQATPIVASTVYPVPTATVAPAPVPPTPVGVGIWISCDTSLDWVDGNLVGQRIEFVRFELDYTIVVDENGVQYCLPLHDGQFGYHGVAILTSTGLTYDKFFLDNQDEGLDGILVKGGIFSGEKYYLQGPVLGQVEGPNDALMNNVWPEWVDTLRERTADVLAWDYKGNGIYDFEIAEYPQDKCNLMYVWDYLVPVPEGLECKPWHPEQRFRLAGETRVADRLWIRVLLPTREEYVSATRVEWTDEPMRPSRAVELVSCQYIRNETEASFLIMDMGSGLNITGNFWVDPIDVTVVVQKRIVSFTMPREAVFQFESDFEFFPTLYTIQECN